MKKIKGGYFPAIVAGLLFGIWHGVFVQGVYTALGGIVLGLLYKKTKSLYASIGGHMLNNLMSIFIEEILVTQ